MDIVLYRVANTRLQCLWSGEQILPVPEGNPAESESFRAVAKEQTDYKEKPKRRLHRRSPNEPISPISVLEGRAELFL